MDQQLVTLYELARKSAEAAKGLKQGVLAERHEVYSCVCVLKRIKRKKFPEDVVNSTHVARRFRIFTSHGSSKIRRAAENLLESWNRQEKENSEKKKKEKEAETCSFRCGDECRDNVRETIAVGLWLAMAVEIGESITAEEKEKFHMCDPWRVAVRVELELFEKLGRFTTGPMKLRKEVLARWKYRPIMAQFNWRKKDSHEFRIKVLLGEISPKDLLDQ